MFIIFALTMIGFLVLAIYFNNIGLGGTTVFIQFLELITIALPPALAVAMNLAITYAVTVLRKK